MKKKIGIILAAGKQTRFESDIPKALVQYKDHTVLEHNIELLKSNVDKILVICSEWNYEQFKKLNIENENLELISINSGFGCGHGVMESLKLIKEYADIILIWGDSIQNKFVIDELVCKYRGYVLVPVVIEKKPYVQFKTDKGFITHVSFSKYNQHIDDIGYHDLSIFMFDKDFVYKKLIKMHKKYWKDDEYKTKSKELVFLELFNENKKFGKILKINNIQSMAFNTVEEYNRIIESKD